MSDTEDGFSNNESVTGGSDQPVKNKATLYPLFYWGSYNWAFDISQLKVEVSADATAGKRQECH